MRWRSAGFACVALAVAAVAAPGFQAPSPGPATPEERSPRLIPRTPAERERRFAALHRVILNVRVSDAAGKPQSDLNEANFTLYDNDQPRKLVSFRAVNGTAGGAHVILVLDAVNVFSKQLREFEQEIERYLKEGDGLLPVPVAIGVFSGFGIDVGQPSRDRGALLTELGSRTSDLRATGCITLQDHGSVTARPFSPGGIGGMRAQSPRELACKNDRFVESVSALSELARKQKDVPGRVILVWFGPGWPMLTDKAFEPDTPELKRNFFIQLVSLSMLLREAQITVDTVASPDESINPQTPNVRDSEFFGGVSDPNQVSAADLGLHVLAHQTGGRILTETKDVAGQISACISDAESYYVLSFDSPPAADFGEYHAVAVKVDKPGVDVRTNTLYYGEQ